VSTRVVVKVGGAVASGSADAVLGHVAAGSEVVVVHGAGPQISAELERRGIASEFVRGLRVTGPEAVAVVRESLVAVGAELAAALGPTARPLVGDEIGLRARQLTGLGLVGEPAPCRPPAIEQALAAGQIPVVAPIAEGPLNVNADDAASALAIGLGAERIVFVTDVPGVYVEGMLADRIEAVEADRMLAEGAFEGGIVPKLLAAVRAAKLGLQAEIGATEVLA
jgi:acetylglutamate kinase